MNGRAAITLALTLALLAASGCSRSSEPAAPPPAPSEAPSTPVPPPSPTAVEATTAVIVYLVEGERVAAVRREARLPSVAAQAVRALLAGPTAAERSRGLGSAVPTGTALRSLSITAGVATIDLSGAFASGGGSLSMRMRAAQVVCTLTGFRTVRSVRFRLDGSPLTALGGEGLILDTPQTAAAFEDLIPPIVIETPQPGDAAGATLSVRGTADVFEAVFFLEIRDGAGRLLVRRRVLASAGTGTRGRFSATLALPSGTGDTGELVGWVTSPKDGSRVVLARIALRLEDRP
ncbi:MAG: GerMN domain-containing protein [Coriobacteriia bacterium]